MERKVAVLVNDKMQTSTFGDSGNIVLYTKANNQWNIEKSISYEIRDALTLNIMRKMLTDLIKSLEHCKIIVGREITGIAYNLFDKAGFDIWEIDDASPEFLDYAAENGDSKVAVEASINPEGESIAYPKEIKDGYYIINLKELQQTNSKLTSKQVLLPFLSNAVFYKLQVICSHIPPWFEKELNRLTLKAKVMKVKENEYNIIIYNKTCDE